MRKGIKKIFYFILKVSVLALILTALKNPTWSFRVEEGYYPQMFRNGPVPAVVYNWSSPGMNDFSYKNRARFTPLCVLWPYEVFIQNQGPMHLVGATSEAEWDGVYFISTSSFCSGYAEPFSSTPFNNKHP